MALRALTLVLSCALVAVLVPAALSLGTAQARYAFIALAAVLGLAFCLSVPQEILPTLALVAVVVVPDRIADYSSSPVLMPASLLLTIWVVRRLLGRASAGTVAPEPVRVDRSRRSLTLAAVLLGAGMVPLLLVAPVLRFSLGWVATYVVAVVAPLLLGDVEKEVRRLRQTLPWLSSVAAGYAVVQSLLQQNVLYGSLYELLGLDEVQHWAVYRADGSFGHPLTAGLFFATMLAFSVGRWLETQRFRFTVAAALNGLGIVATVSRGAYISAAVAVSAVLLVALLVHHRHRARRVLLLAVFAAAALFAVNTDAFVERGLSTEGVSSINARRALPEIAWNTARAGHWLGGGPANSSTVAAPYNFQNLPIENSYLQLLIDVGVWGLALFVLILVLASVIALRHRNLSGLGALLGYATALSGYAAIDSRRDLVVLLGLLLMVSLQPREPEEAVRPSTAGHSSAAGPVARDALLHGTRAPAQQVVVRRDRAATRSSASGQPARLVELRRHG